MAMFFRWRRGAYVENVENSMRRVRGACGGNLDNAPQAGTPPPRGGPSYAHSMTDKKHTGSKFHPSSELLTQSTTRM